MLDQITTSTTEERDAFLSFINAYDDQDYPVSKIDHLVSDRVDLVTTAIRAAFHTEVPDGTKVDDDGFLVVEIDPLEVAISDEIDTAVIDAIIGVARRHGWAAA